MLEEIIFFTCYIRLKSTCLLHTKNHLKNDKIGNLSNIQELKLIGEALFQIQKQGTEFKQKITKFLF